MKHLRDHTERFSTASIDISQQATFFDFFLRSLTGGEIHNVLDQSTGYFLPLIISAKLVQTFMGVIFCSARCFKVRANKARASLDSSSR
jgi:hypothetical protein